jgi:diacylglycerol kinase (ATP)
VIANSVNGRVVILVNTIAGRGKGRLVARRIAQELGRTKIEAKIVADEPGEAVELARGARALVVIGGDGTLRAAAREIVRQKIEAPAILPVPMGTANLMGKYLGIDWESEELPGKVAEAIERGKRAGCDVAAVNGEAFLLMAGVGIDAEIVHEVGKDRKGPINYASYILPAARALVSYEYPALEVWVDGKEVFELAPAVAFVGNVSQYGTGFAMVPEARPDDGLLDLVVVPVSSVGEAIRKFLFSAAGEHVEEEGVVHMRGKEIVVRSPVEVPVQADGDPAGNTPATFGLLPVRLQFIVPT